MALRKKLHNQLVDLKGNIRVFCRIRPKIGEDGKGPESEFTIFPDARDDQLCLYTDPKTKKKTQFDYTRTFGPTSTQTDVFEEAKDLVLSAIDGYNVCIFAYGQTGSGKTFSMEGTPSDPGLNKRALSALFETCAEKAADWSYVCRCFPRTICNALFFFCSFVFQLPDLSVTSPYCLCFSLFGQSRVCR
jgi:kinesin family protein C2/C3